MVRTQQGRHYFCVQHKLRLVRWSKWWPPANSLLKIRWISLFFFFEPSPEIFHSVWGEHHLETIQISLDPQVGLHSNMKFSLQRQQLADCCITNWIKQSLWTSLQCLDIFYKMFFFFLRDSHLFTKDALTQQKTCIMFQKIYISNAVLLNFLFIK